MNIMSVVKINHVHKQYQLGKTSVKALQGVSLEIQKGEFLSIGGPSGSGKSTLLNLIGAIDLPDQGTVEVAGENLAHLNDNALSHLRAKHVGFIFQSFNLIPVLTALENVEYPLLLTQTRHSKES